MDRNGLIRLCRRLLAGNATAADLRRWLDDYAVAPATVFRHPDQVLLAAVGADGRPVVCEAWPPRPLGAFLPLIRDSYRQWVAMCRQTPGGRDPEPLEVTVQALGGHATLGRFYPEQFPRDDVAGVAP